MLCSASSLSSCFATSQTPNTSLPSVCVAMFSLCVYFVCVRTVCAWVGTVIAVDHEHSLYRVLYTDGDQEDIDPAAFVALAPRMNE